MRIIGGALGGRRFRGPPGDLTRPTAERVREAVASALEARGALAGAVVLDLFAGTGALAFEALSRGASRAVLVDHDRRTCRALTESARELGLADRAVVVATDLLAPGRDASPAVRRALAVPANLIFADPPYDHAAALPAVLDALWRAGAVAPGAWVMLESRAKDPSPAWAALASAVPYRYGDTAVLIGRVSTEGPP